MTEFTDLGLPKTLISRLEKAGISAPTPIQARAIPHALEGRDVMGLAQTGTGKTFAFGLPLVARLLSYGRKPEPKTARGLILAPTRELANQIRDSLMVLVEGTPMKVGLVVGGVSINPQISRVAKGTDIIVATPGRLIDLMERDALDLSATDFLVLDEADQMLDLGFIHALRKISEWLPKKRQTMLFSATMPKQMAEIAGTYLDNPERVQVAPPGKTADKVTQGIHYIAKAEKTGLLIELLDGHRDEAAIVFARTKHGSDRLMKALVKAGYAAAAVHGNKSQGQRERAIKAFREGETMVLVATDVAARGLDIPQVRHVYNYDLPNVPENYVHRIGRTARAGMDGAAVAFCAPDEIDELKAIQKVLKMSIPVLSGRPWMGLEEKPGQKQGQKQGRKQGQRQAQGQKQGQNADGPKPKSKGPRRVWNGGGKPGGSKPGGGGGRRRGGGGGAGRGRGKSAA
ncbi:DEAD/DEAH box helicase [Shimia aestuarii]|uniref:DEAD/DEAH box helicase n=1 Tax=Shimia aestuarii TaxID=254406 RepID=UPI001FB23A08|nr:DEAD/DEAH box helicase [Shimia aestuarii]